MLIESRGTKTQCAHPVSGRFFLKRASCTPAGTYLQAEHKVTANALLGDDVLHRPERRPQVRVEELRRQQAHRWSHKVIWQGHVRDLREKTNRWANCQMHTKKKPASLSFLGADDLEMFCPLRTTGPFLWKVLRESVPLDHPWDRGLGRPGICGETPGTGSRRCSASVARGRWCVSENSASLGLGVTHWVTHDTGDFFTWCQFHRACNYSESIVHL